MIIFMFTPATVFALSVKETANTEFSLGTHNGTLVVNSEDGEVILGYDTESIETPLSILKNSAFYDIKPKIATDKNGVVYAAWHEKDGNNTFNDIWFSKSVDGGVSWSTAVQVDNGDENCPTFPANSLLPDIIVDDSDTPTKVYIAWTDDRGILCGPGQFFNVWFSGSNDGGTTWSNDVLVNNYPSLSGLGSLIGNPDEAGEYARTYPSGGPKLALGAAPDNNILVTWMNDEVWWADYDVYYSKAEPSYPDYVFDADFSTTCNPADAHAKNFQTAGCEDAKADDNLSDPDGQFSGIPSISAYEDKVAIAYEDDRLKWYPSTNIYSLTFTEYGDDVSPFPLIGNQLLPMTTLPPYAQPTVLSVRVDDDNNYQSREPDLKIDIEGNILIAWEDDGPTGVNNLIYFDKSTDEGASFGSDLAVSDVHMMDPPQTHNSESFFPSLEIDPTDADKVYLTYDDEFDTTTGVYFDKSLNGGATWGSDVRVAGGDGVIEAVHSNLSFNPKTHTLFAVWGDLDTMNSRGDGAVDYDLYSSRSLNLGDDWGQYYTTTDENTAYTSKAIDLGNYVTFSENNLSWTEDVSKGGEIKLQLRTADTETSLAEADFVGPAGTNEDYYTYAEGTKISSSHNNDRWIQYKAYFTGDADRTATPILKDVTIEYTDDGSIARPAGDGTCQTNADCSLGQTCREDMCTDLSINKDICNSNDDCENGEICTSGGYCGPADSCAGFPDVSTYDPQCAAIQYVKDEGIFEGYPDGNFKSKQAINRAETGKVILEAFNKQIMEDDGTDVGYSDSKVGEWYIPYFLTAKALNIITGYPDGTVRPDQTVIKVELLKIFFVTAPVKTNECQSQPYPDTPLNEGTNWYTPFVCYAKENKLMDADLSGNFYPTDGMLRGDVAELFYRYNNRIGEY